MSNNTKGHKSFKFFGIAKKPVFTKLLPLLIVSGIKFAKKGNYQFYKDIFDRIYGSAEKKESDRPINVAMILNKYEK